MDFNLENNGVGKQFFILFFYALKKLLLSRSIEIGGFSQATETCVTTYLFPMEVLQLENEQKWVKPALCAGGMHSPVGKTGQKKKQL